MSIRILTGPYATSINGKRVEATLEMIVHECELTLEDVLVADAGDFERVRAQIEAGELRVIDLEVRVSAHGFEGVDYLSACIVSSPHDVRDAIAIANQNCMPELAAEQLVNSIIEAYEQLKPYFDTGAGK